MSTKAAELVATGTIVATGCRVMGIYFTPTASGGSVVLRAGGASGTIVLTLDAPAAVGAMYIDVPGAGLDFGDDCHATLNNVDGLTVFYEDL